MNLGTMEQRTEGMKRQAQELIEQVYQCGFKAGQERAMEMEISKYIDKGRNEAWEVADKLNRMTLDEVIKVFADNPFCHTITRENIFDFCMSSYAIRKVHDYEKKKKEEKDIKVGDEVIPLFGISEPMIAVTVDKNRIYGFDKNGNYRGASRKETEFKKTGRHFPEIAEVIEKMKEEQ